MPDVSTSGAAAAGAEDGGDSGPDDDAGPGDDAGADDDAETGDDGAALTDGLGTGEALAVAELLEACCADTTAEPQPAAASAAASTSTENADDRPRIAGLRSNKCTSSPDTRMRDQP